MIAAPPIPQPDSAVGHHQSVQAGRVAWFPATVIDEATGQPLPNMQWRCVVTLKAGKVHKACVLIGTIPLHPTSPDSEAPL
jgi:hypothetical protein